MTTLTFTQALVQAEAQARSTLDVALHERLSAGVALVQDGLVFQTTDGTWQVHSSSQEGRVYAVNGLCQCDDHHYNKPAQGLCKHRLAMFLSARAHLDATAVRAGGPRARGSRSGARALAR
jgi:hypothetical protein